MGERESAQKLVRLGEVAHDEVVDLYRFCFLLLRDIILFFFFFSSSFFSFFYTLFNLSGGSDHDLLGVSPCTRRWFGDVGDVLW